jgi:hypothetical protein
MRSPSAPARAATSAAGWPGPASRRRSSRPRWCFTAGCSPGCGSSCRPSGGRTRSTRTQTSTESGRCAPRASAAVAVRGASFLPPAPQRRSHRAVPQVGCPIAVIHGAEDEIVPFIHGTPPHPAPTHTHHHPPPPSWGNGRVAQASSSSPRRGSRSNRSGWRGPTITTSSIVSSTVASSSSVRPHTPSPARPRAVDQEL